MSESAIQRAILETLTALGCTVWRNQAGKVRVRGGYMALSPEGTPDIVGYTRDGRFLAIEVKAPKGREREAQLLWRERAQKAGCIVGVARSVQDAIALLLGSEGPSLR